MGFNAALDVVSGLVLTYLALSVLCTIVNELAATVLGWRAQSLAGSLVQIIDAPALRQAFYGHGLISGAPSAPDATGGAAVQHPSYIAGETFAMAVLGSLDTTKPLPAMVDIQDAVLRLPASHIRDSLLAQIGSAQGDMDRLRTHIAVGFDRAMDRLSGAYKRKLKVVTLATGLVLAVALNVDTIRIAEVLWHDTAIRQELVSLAPTLSDLGTGQADDGASPQARLSGIRTMEEVLRPLPLGWDADAFKSLGLVAALYKAVGLLLTALALSLGAPFWFDLLSKLINLRGTGRKPERTVPD
jgi:hypothetical protein